MEQVILWILAAGAFIGGLDLLTGSHFGLGDKFKEGFNLLGPTALSMVGILCLAPLLSSGLKATIAPLWQSMHLDPAMLGGILAIDMGGYQMASELAQSPEVGRYAGILVASTLGCTVSFTIPMSIGMMRKQDSDDFFRGILIGLCVMPVALMLGGIMSGMDFTSVFVQTLPTLLLSLVLIAGLHFIPAKTLKVFSAFAALIRWMSIIGLTIGAVQYISGFTFIPGLAPIEDAMKVVSGIGVVMLGSLPAAELLRRALAKPLRHMGKKFGLNDTNLTAVLIGFVSVTPALAMVNDMDSRGKTMNAAFLVCAASTLASHLGYTLSVYRDMLIPLLVTKLVGGMLGIVFTLLLVKRPEK